MESFPSPPLASAEPFTPTRTIHGLPSRVFIGLTLMGIGAAITVATYAWNFFGPRMYVGFGFEDFIRISVALSATEFLCLQIGLFLVLSGILRILPPSRPWSRIGPLLILIGAVIVAGFGITDLFLMGSTGATPGGLLEGLYLALLVLDIAGYLATTVGLIVSLFAAVHGVLARRPSAATPPQT